jgi:peptidoglycan/LPS O-acetylase OafA/YrhL
VESHFYLVLPVLIWLFRGLNVRQLTLALFLILFFVPLFARCLTWPTGVYAFDGANREMHMLLKRFPTQLDYFAWGVLMAGLFTSVKPVLPQLKGLSLLGYVGAALLALSLYQWGLWQQEFNIRVQPTLWADEVRHFLPALCAFLMLFFIFDPHCFGARCLSSGWLRFTGVISYEWFLFHPPVCHWFLAHGGHAGGSIVAYAWKTLFPVAFTFIFSALVYRYFSLPILNKVRDRIRPPAPHSEKRKAHGI